MLGMSASKQRSRRWGRGLVLVLAVLVLGFSGLVARGHWVRTRTIELPKAGSTLVVRSGEPQAIERGRHLARDVLVCVECHGDDLGGELYIDALPFVRLVGPNLTPNPDAPTADYAAADWDRAIRHDLDRSGRPLVMMPAEGYASLSNRDLGDLIAYLESLPAIERELPASKIGPFGAIALALGNLDLSARVIDHAAVGTHEPAVGRTREYGRYLVEVSGCRGCHGPDLEGRSFGPNQPRAPALTAEALEPWTVETFARALRTGVDRAGEALDPLMPSASFAGLSEVELDALWMFLSEREPASP